MTLSPHRHDCRVSQVISRRSEAPSAVRVFGVSPRSGPFRWGPVYRLTGQLSGGGRKIFCRVHG
ncbi:hypothetical protein FZ558_004626 [Escherichia coli]|nr:hypothetical protein [Escherichia coli]EER9091609.1 hypothetical protein [Escherichia coli]EES3828323.1 hypothetical protein [Escherichia coli]EFG7848736.1 hypothetical protein [Escherichia coli]